MLPRHIKNIPNSLIYLRLTDDQERDFENLEESLDPTKMSYLDELRFYSYLNRAKNYYRAEITPEDGYYSRDSRGLEFFIYIFTMEHYKELLRGFNNYL